MTLEPGARLGPYKIVSPLGTGGMGEVWKAHDPRLKRDVAIKIAKRQFSSDVAREARTIAALNHPNICQIYDVGPDYIVMELVEAGRITAPLALDEALEIAGQIARAIDAAHEKGIVHRDLKPGNILIARNGVVKVLDFGLAQVTGHVHPEGGTENPESTATQTVPIETGSFAGTPAYMAPEQARGCTPDKRADIWAFGVVLFELLTGEQPFHGATRTDTVLAVVGKEPDISKAPYQARRLLRCCLEKDPRKRLRDIGDWDKLLDADGPSAAKTDSVRARPLKLLWFAAAFAAIAAGLLTYGWARSRDANPPSAEPIYTRLTDDEGLNDYPALSRDGKLAAYSSDRAGNGNLDIWLKQIGGREAIRLTSDSEDETDPSFSPDGTRIAYRSEKGGGGIYTIQTLGGEPALLAAAGRNPRYSPDGRWIAYWTGRGEGSSAPGSSRILVIDANGGTPRAIHPEMSFAKFPVWSPRGDALIVVGQKNGGGASDYLIVPVDGGTVVETGAAPLLRSRGWLRFQLGMRVEPAVADWVYDGGNRLLLPLLYGDSANLWEALLDGKGAAEGIPARVTRGPGRQVHASLAIAGGERRMAFADEAVSYDLWAKSAGQPPARITATVSSDWAPALSLDGTRMTYIAHRSGSWSVMLRSLENGRESALASSAALIVNAAISGDGSRVAWSDGTSDTFAVSSGGGASEKLCSRCGNVLALSRDGRFAAYEPVSDEDVKVVDSAEHRTITLAGRTPTETLLSGTQFSADMKWIAFHSVNRAAEATQVWIAPVDLRNPAARENWIAVTDGKTFAQDPVWSPDGNTVYFVSERDGFRCYWGQRLEARTKHPEGEPFAVQHFHSARETLRGAGSDGYVTRLAVGGSRIVFAAAEVRGSIWLEEEPHGRPEK